MRALTPEQREYKEKTLNHLLAHLPVLEEKLAQENRPAVQKSIQDQLDDIHAHIDRLQTELASGVAGEPVADNLCVRIASALTKEKFYLAKKYLNKLETIEPFYPGIDRLRADAEAGRAGRRTRAIAQGSAPPFGAAVFPPGRAVAGPAPDAGGESEPVLAENGGRKGVLAQFFQFHIVVSCLIVLLILCVMLGVGGVTVLEWLLQGA